jgi:hypothetical protein
MEAIMAERGHLVHGSVSLGLMATGSENANADAGATTNTDADTDADADAAARKLLTFDRSAPYAWSNPPPCSAALVQELLATDTLNGWLQRVGMAYQGLNPDDAAYAWFAFRDWFIQGIVTHLPPTHPNVLELEWQKALDDVADGAAQRATALVKKMHEAGDSKEHRALLAHALVLLARRLGEEADMQAACGAAQRAQEIFAQLGDQEARAFAIRVRAAALVFLNKKSEALALLDEVAQQRGPTSFARSGMFRRIAGTEDNVALWSTPAGYDWVHTHLDTAWHLRAEAREAAEREANKEDDDSFERGPFV